MRHVNIRTELIDGDPITEKEELMILKMYASNMIEHDYQMEVNSNKIWFKIYNLNDGVGEVDGVTLGVTGTEHSGKGLIGLSTTRRSCSNLRETSHKYSSVIPQDSV